MATLDESKRDKRKFWRSLPRSSVFKLSLAVFFTFATLGFVTDLFHPNGAPYYPVLVMAAYSGLGALVFLLVIMREAKWLFGLVPVFIAVAIEISRLLPSHPLQLPVPPELQRRLILDAIFTLVMVHTGYALFLAFIETEGFKHMRVQTEMELAERLQTTLVPPLSIRTGLVQVEARSTPSSAMGGDLADAVECEGSVTCYIADVSGHGVAAGVLMGMVKTGVRMALLRGDDLEGILRSLHRVLPGLKEPSSYVTFAGLRFGRGVAEYSTAGHLPILHYRHSTRTVQRLRIEQFPLGIIPQAAYRAAKTECGRDDVFMLLTDGIVEVVDARDEEFGLEPIERLLLENSTRPLAAIADIVITKSGKHGQQMDDQTILLARVTG